jgi:hypothetical protein
VLATVSTSYTAFNSGQMTVIGIRGEVERELLRKIAAALET